MLLKKCSVLPAEGNAECSEKTRPTACSALAALPPEPLGPRPTAGESDAAHDLLGEHQSDRSRPMKSDGRPCISPGQNHPNARLGATLIHFSPSRLSLARMAVLSCHQPAAVGEAPRRGELLPFLCSFSHPPLPGRESETRVCGAPQLPYPPVAGAPQSALPACASSRRRARRCQAAQRRCPLPLWGTSFSRDPIDPNTVRGKVCSSFSLIDLEGVDLLCFSFYPKNLSLAQL